MIDTVDQFFFLHGQFMISIARSGEVEKLRVGCHHTWIEEHIEIGQAIGFES
jgi:hypothetical protein